MLPLIILDLDVLFISNTFVRVSFVTRDKQSYKHVVVLSLRINWNNENFLYKDIVDIFVFSIEG